MPHLPRKKCGAQGTPGHKSLWSLVSIIWNLGTFLKFLDIFGKYFDFFGKSINRVLLVIVSKLYNFDVSICYKSFFFWFSKYFFYFVSFSCCISQLFSPLCFSFLSPIVFPQWIPPFVGRRPRATLAAFPLEKTKGTNGNNMKQNETNRFSKSVTYFHQFIKMKRLTLNSLWAL